MTESDDKIPIEWIGTKLVTPLLRIAKTMDPGPFRDSVCLRAEHYMDLVESWQKRHEDKTQ